MTEDATERADQLSALMDGQLRGEELAHALCRLAQDEEARLTWHAYHLAADVLRCGESVLSRHEATFLQRVRLGLQELPSPARHRVTVELTGVTPATSDLALGQRRMSAASNDAHGRWKVWLGVASLVAVAAVGWQLVSDLGDHQPEMQQAMIRDPQLDALLAAHRQSGGTPTLPLATDSLHRASVQGGSR